MGYSKFRQQQAGNRRMPSVKNIGKPCAGKSHARFDEGGQASACSLLYPFFVKPMDALHVACAIEAHAEYFLTTDNALLRKMAKYGKIRVVDPVDFVRELNGKNDEN
jgi:hypothetical protein